MTKPQAGENQSDTPDVAAKEPPTPDVTDRKPEAVCESSLNLSEEPLLGPNRWRETLKRLRIWLSDPPWWASQAVVALVGGLVTLVVSLQVAFVGNQLSEQQATHAEQLENLRFVRERASTGSGSKDNPLPFAKLDLQGQDLAALKLAHANFVYANLSYADLYQTSLAASYLEHVNFENATVAWADISGAELMGATLRGADLAVSDLSLANLSGVDLTRAHLFQANLTDARFSAGSWAGLRSSQYEEFGPAILAGADLSGADLSGANLRRAKLNDAILSATKGVSLPNHPQVVDMPPANLAGADLSSAQLCGAGLAGADLSRANLNGAILSYADLSGAVLSGADLSGIYYNSLTKWPAGFRPPPPGGQKDCQYSRG